jgi:hypothetical protein
MLADTGSFLIGVVAGALAVVIVLFTVGRR